MLEAVLSAFLLRACRASTHLSLVNAKRKMPIHTINNGNVNVSAPFAKAVSSTKPRSLNKSMKVNQ